MTLASSLLCLLCGGPGGGAPGRFDGRFGQPMQSMWSLLAGGRFRPRRFLPDVRAAGPRARAMGARPGGSRPSHDLPPHRRGARWRPSLATPWPTGATIPSAGANVDDDGQVGAADAISHSGRSRRRRAGPARAKPESRIAGTRRVAPGVPILCGTALARGGRSPGPVSACRSQNAWRQPARRARLGSAAARCPGSRVHTAPRRSSPASFHRRCQRAATSI